MGGALHTSGLPAILESSCPDSCRGLWKQDTSLECPRRAAHRSGPLESPIPAPDLGRWLPPEPGGSLPGIQVSRTRIRNLARSLDLPDDDLLIWLLDHAPELGELHPADFLSPEIEARARAALARPATPSAPDPSVERRCPPCMEAPGRLGARVVAAEGGAPCDRCGGSVNKREALALIATFVERGISRLLVVGGGPGTAEELRNLLGEVIDLQIVDGETHRNATQAASELAWADVVVIWSSTILPHKVSKLYTDRRTDYKDKLVTVTRRGAAALCKTVVDKVKRELRSARR